MKIVWVALSLLVSTLSIGIGCGPKETYCYKEGKPCSTVKREMETADAGFMAEMPDADKFHCFDKNNVPYESDEPCPL